MDPEPVLRHPPSSHRTSLARSSVAVALCQTLTLDRAGASSSIHSPITLPIARIRIRISFSATNC
ncbi:hypothetical protein C8R44DRAFT_881385 [Mycena epipterygia]|nr:hypothetical protein C8R44DRAFT_881385 [Mycena epipterygia]